MASEVCIPAKICGRRYCELRLRQQGIGAYAERGRNRIKSMERNVLLSKLDVCDRRAPEPYPSCKGGLRQICLFAQFSNKPAELYVEPLHPSCLITDNTVDVNVADVSVLMTCE